MKKYDIFEPKNGMTLWQIRTSWLARLTIKLFGRGRFLDYEIEGEGWIERDIS